MKEKQQIATETNSLPFEKELLSLTRKAIVNGYSQSQIINLLKQYWNSSSPDLPVETEDEIAFREKVEKFMKTKYEEFDKYSYDHFFKGSSYWDQTDHLNPEVKRKFIYEVSCTIYKGFKMDTFDRNALKKINVERTKILFPSIRGHVLFYNLILNQLLGYVYNYKVKEKDELEQYLSKFELQGKDDEVVTKFVWLIENLI